VTLRKFSEFYKDKATKRKQRAQRYEASLEKKKDELATYILAYLAENDPNYPDPQDHLQDPLFQQMCQFTPEADALWKKHFESNLVSVPFKYRGEERIKQVSGYKILTDLAAKYQTTVNTFQEKETDDDDNPTVIDKFDKTKIVLDEEEECILKSERWLEEERSFPEAEKLYYGFEWVHQLETCEKYQGITFDKFLEECEGGENMWAVEVRVEQVRKRTSKSNVEFYSVDIEDANGKMMVCNIWKDDMTRWKDEIKKGKLLRMRVRPPSGGFNTLTLESVPRHEKLRKWPDKASDPRIFELTPPEPKKPVEPIFDDFGLTDEPGWEELS
jgi:chemotaxis protein histidine kinase CheA